MIADSVIRKKRLRDHIIRDGALGHLVGIESEGRKLEKIKDAYGQIPQPDAEAIRTGKVPEFFAVRLPGSEALRTYQILKVEVDSKSGFKALAYREVTSDTHTLIAEQGKAELYLSFQGRIGGKGDNLTTTRLLFGKRAAHVREVEKFIHEVIGAAGGRGRISMVYSCSHCVGGIDAIEAYRAVKKAGIERVEVVMMETWGARSALEHLAVRMAEEWRVAYRNVPDQGRAELRKYGFADAEAEQIILSERAYENVGDSVMQAFFRKVAEHTTTINSGPRRSSMNCFPNGVGDPAGAVYMLDVSNVEHWDEKGQKTEQTGTDRHRLTTMIQACYFDDVFPEHVGNILTAEPKKRGVKAAILRWRNKDKTNPLDMILEPANTQSLASVPEIATFAQ